jgi:hypothetical protein
VSPEEMFIRNIFNYCPQERRYISYPRKWWTEAKTASLPNLEWQKKNLALNDIRRKLLWCGKKEGSSHDLF